MAPKKTVSKEEHNKNIESIVDALESSKKSENMSDYTDSDGEGWGPALGCAVNAAKEHNETIPNLIKFMKSLRMK